MDVSYTTIVGLVVAYYMRRLFFNIVCIITSLGVIVFSFYIINQGGSKQTAGGIAEKNEISQGISEGNMEKVSEKFFEFMLIFSRGYSMIILQNMDTIFCCT